MSIIEPGKLILTVSETGYGRLSSPDDYRLQKRSGMGLTNYHVKKYGDVAALSVVSPDDDLILISQNGVIIRILASTVRVCARPSKGVTVMRIKDDNRVVTVANVPHDEEETQAVTEDSAAIAQDAQAMAEETAEE